MKSFNTLLILLLILLFFWYPEIYNIDGFWIWVFAIWFSYLISWIFIGDLADEISGVNKYKDFHD